MENKLVNMERKKSKSDFKLLPTYWKTIGFCVLLLCGAGALLVRIKGLSLTPEGYNQSLNFLLHGIILGLLMIAASRDKEEDELTQSIRVKSMATVFITNGVLVVMQPLFTLMGDEPIVPFTAAHLMVESLVFYLLLFSFQKLMR